MPLITGRLRSLLKGGAPRLFSCGQRVVAAFGTDFQTGARNPHLDIAIGAAGGGSGGVAQSVLVSGVTGGAGVSKLDVVPGEFGEYFTAGSARILRQDVAVAIMRQMEFLQLAVDGNGGTLHTDGIHRDVAGQKNFEHVAVGNFAAVLASVADDEDDLSPCTVALAEV